MPSDAEGAVCEREMGGFPGDANGDVTEEVGGFSGGATVDAAEELGRFPGGADEDAVVEGGVGVDAGSVPGEKNPSFERLDPVIGSTVFS